MDSELMQKRKEEFDMSTKKIQNSSLRLPDIRNRTWMSGESHASKILKLALELENLLMELDEYQMDNDQCYPDIEDMMLEFGEFRKKYTNFVDTNLEVLDIKKEV